MTPRTRLTKVHVKTIFDCVSNNQLPRSGLSFKIIRCPKANAKVSPPPFEYDEGIYILLNDPSKQGLEHIPSALVDLILTDEVLNNRKTCHWRSSGLKSHRNNIPTAKYLVRYCYPQNENYSNNKGATIWTQRDERGEEDFSVRILHIYETCKRQNSDRLLYQPKKKKKKQWLPEVSKSFELCEDDNFQSLMGGELITTPICAYQDHSHGFVYTLSSRESWNAEGLFDEGNDICLFN